MTRKKQLLAGCCKEDVHDEAHGHDNHAVDSKGQSHLPNEPVLEVLEVPAPLAAPSPRAVPATSITSGAVKARGALRQLGRVLNILVTRVLHVIILLEEALVVDAVWVADLVVEKAREDEADGCRAGTANECKHAVEAVDGEGSDVCQREDESSQECEASVGHGCCRVIAARWRCW